MWLGHYCGTCWLSPVVGIRRVTFRNAPTNVFFTSFSGFHGEKEKEFSLAIHRGMREGSDGVHSKKPPLSYPLSSMPSKVHRRFWRSSKIFRSFSATPPTHMVRSLDGNDEMAFQRAEVFLFV